MSREKPDSILDMPGTPLLEGPWDQQERRPREICIELGWGGRQGAELGGGKRSSCGLSVLFTRESKYDQTRPDVF